MKRVTGLMVLIMLGTALLGCQQGVTDIGNPNIVKPPQASPNTLSPAPTIGQLIGGYSGPLDAAAAPSPGGDSDSGPSPTAPHTIPSCQTDSFQNPSIAATSDPKQIILNHFLDYGSATENILATYDSKTGAIAFDISDASVTIVSCAGTASNASSGVRIELKCKATEGGDPVCQATLNKEAL